MFKYKLLVPIIFLILIALALVVSNQKVSRSQLKIGSKVISIEIVDNELAREKGLSGRASLAENSGMLFKFPKPIIGRFWMKDMRFSIDIIWIHNGKVVGIEKNAPIPADATIATFSSPELIDQVLEVNGGFCDKNNLKIGDKVALQV